MQNEEEVIVQEESPFTRSELRRDEAERMRVRLIPKVIQIAVSESMASDDPWSCTQMLLLDNGHVYRADNCNVAGNEDWVRLELPDECYLEDEDAKEISGEGE